MKITLLVYVEQESSTEYDKSVDQIAKALTQVGHQPSILCVHGDLDRLISELRHRKPDLIFNLMEQFADRMLGLVEVTGLIDLLDIPYTGSGAGELYLQEDKGLTKKLLAFENVLCPDYVVFSPQADLETGGKLHMPLFVKPLRMDASFGIDAQSLVQNTTELMARVQEIHEKFHDAALCEQYIEGREFYIGILGNQNPQAFPPVEMDFSQIPDGTPHVMGAKAKFDEATPEYQGTQAIVPEISDELRAKLQQVALDSYRALRIRDYGRVDLRIAESGEIYVIEVNANCYLEEESEYAMAARAAGMDYPQLISQIVDLAMERHQAGKVGVVPRHARNTVASSNSA